MEQFRLGLDGRAREGEHELDDLHGYLVPADPAWLRVRAIGGYGPDDGADSVNSRAGRAHRDGDGTGCLMEDRRSDCDMRSGRYEP